MFVVCEPQCEGLEHVAFNAALLASAQAAFGEVRFLAEREHLQLVRHELERAGVPGIRFEAIRIHPRHSGGPARFVTDGRIAHRALELAKESSAEGLLFSSHTSQLLLALRALGPLRVPCATVAHAALERFASPGASLLPAAISSAAEGGVRLLVLSPHIERELLARAPQLEGHTAAFEHPLLNVRAPRTPSKARRVRVGTVGVAHPSRGFGLVASLARELGGRVELVHIGPVAREQAGLAEAGVTLPGGGFPLNRDRFEAELDAVDYALFPFPKDAYRLSASGAVLEAVAFAKPLLALRCGYVEHVFEALGGDCGVLCDSEAALREALRSLEGGVPEETYLRQQAAIVRGRERFLPAAVGERLRTLFG